MELVEFVKALCRVVVHDELIEVVPVHGSRPMEEHAFLQEYPEVVVKYQVIVVERDALVL